MTGSSELQQTFQRLGVIIGAMKSATTSLYEALRQHPEVCVSREKETNFFRNPEAGALGEYEAYWDFDPLQHKIAVEASPAYTNFPSWPGTAERLARAPYDTRLIYILRNPIERYVSHQIMNLAKGWQATDLRVELSQRLLGTSCYARQLRQYAPFFRREQILLVRYEALVRTPQAELARIARHLGIDDAIPLSFPQTHSTQSQYLADALLVMMEKAKDPASGFLPVEFKPDGSVDMQATLLPLAAQRKLHQALAQDMRELSEVWDFDVKPWRF